MPDRTKSADERHARSSQEIHPEGDTEKFHKVPLQQGRRNACAALVGVSRRGHSDVFSPPKLFMLSTVQSSNSRERKVNVEVG